ncbi:putative peptidyl-prolyl cis-trans isomerase [Aspergillus mulundensis]|uniref:Peptidyl-prolyl isomerase CWC27 n=1 Tax=Aspergillus mulundensis TaxID=1810919 RepID=A0A3D8T2T8_9EURO|nr:Peptidyl-prolyl isomerase cwc27 [Aspergillus mulundensis]RDW92876.1 Peptidyl-prolyl isomerase cwc27 [Aspergillus mulundensis]
MSAHYATEPAPTASATLNTTFGPLHIALFAKQTPLTCRNFLQHCMDNYYAGTIFHRIVPDFIIQGGDPKGTGSGGTSIYEYPEFEYDPDARDPNEKVVLRDELHSRLRFNRRGLVGMAKSEDGTYGSQFFITLANTERELNGQCTLFGRIEGDTLYNMLKIADAERIEGTERPVYPVKVTSCEVGDLGPFVDKVKKRQIVATGAKTEEKPAAKKKKKAKPGKALLSFGGDDEEGEEDIPIRPAKPKFNPTLVTDTKLPEKGPSTKDSSSQARKRPRSPSPKRERQPSPPPKDRPKTPDHANQLPLPDPESPARSPSPPTKQSFLSRTNAEIENLKASMRRTVHAPAAETKPKSALEAMIPQTAIRGRKRPLPGSVNASSATNGIAGFSSSNSAEAEALKMFNAFKSKLENSDSQPTTSTKRPSTTKPEGKENDDEDEESQLCDLHFIANCQSCQSWDNDAEGGADTAADDDANDSGWLSHQLQFGKDTLGKDLKWKREHQDVDTLMVIDPREKEKELAGTKRGKGRGLERDRERERKRGRVGDLEWSKR